MWQGEAVSEWMDNLQLDATRESQTANAIAWLSLDESDNDPNRSLTYLIAALQTVEANIGQGPLCALHGPQPQPPPTEAILTALINEIATIPGRIVLVLDDYHLIEAQPIHDALTFLLRHLPPHTSPGGQGQGMHLVIAALEDSHLLLARLRARGQLTELRATDLRFSSSLKALEHANLFIVPLDDERRWYCYHHLFADLLRQRLHQTQPEHVPTLHIRASEWYEQNGFADEAIEHVSK
jgi:ATP/maltotriose-dependent transcriptional regulator MalT